MGTGLEYVDLPTPESVKRRLGFDISEKVVLQRQCHNCGGQRMGGRATGRVRLRPDGTPCIHYWEVTYHRPCYDQFRCVYCSDTYDRDTTD